MVRKNILLIVAAVLLITGIVLAVWTEPAGGDGSQASGGIADVSEDTQPYLMWGILVILVAVGVGIFAFVSGRSGS